MPLRSALLDLELVEDRLGLAVARRCVPLLAQPRVYLVETIVGVEDPADQQLWRDGAVPVVLLQAERHVVAAFPPEAVELRALTECNRTSRVATVALHTKAQMLAFTDGRQLTELAAGCEQRNVGIGEPERGKLSQLFAELERELRATREHCVDHGRGHEVFGVEQAFGLLRKRLRELLDPFRCDREAGGRSMAAEALEEGRAGAEGAVQVERGDRAARPLPVPFAAGDQDDGPVVPLDEPRSHDSDHAFVPVFSPDDIRAPTSLRLGPTFDLCDRRAKNLVLDRLPVAVQLLE